MTLVSVLCSLQEHANAKAEGRTREYCVRGVCDHLSSEFPLLVLTQGRPKTLPDDQCSFTSLEGLGAWSLEPEGVMGLEGRGGLDLDLEWGWRSLPGCQFLPQFPLMLAHQGPPSSKPGMSTRGQEPNQTHRWAEKRPGGQGIALWGNSVWDAKIKWQLPASSRSGLQAL